MANATYGPMTPQAMQQSTDILEALKLDLPSWMGGAGPSVMDKIGAGGATLAGRAAANVNEDGTVKDNTIRGMTDPFATIYGGGLPPIAASAEAAPQESPQGTQADFNWPQPGSEAGAAMASPFVDYTQGGAEPPDLNKYVKQLEEAKPELKELDDDDKLGFVMRAIGSAGFDPNASMGDNLLNIGLASLAGAGNFKAAKTDQEAANAEAQRQHQLAMAEARMNAEQQGFKNQMAAGTFQREGQQLNAKQLAPQYIGDGTVLQKTRNGNQIEVNPVAMTGRAQMLEGLAAGATGGGGTKITPESEDIIQVLKENPQQLQTDAGQQLVELMNQAAAQYAGQLGASMNERDLQTMSLNAALRQFQQVNPQAYDMLLNQASGVATQRMLK